MHGMLQQSLGTLYLSENFCSNIFKTVFFYLKRHLGNWVEKLVIVKIKCDKIPSWEPCNEQYFLLKQVKGRWQWKCL